MIPLVKTKMSEIKLWIHGLVRTEKHTYGSPGSDVRYRRAGKSGLSVDTWIPSPCDGRSYGSLSFY